MERDDNLEVEKSKAIDIAKMIEYVPNTVQCKLIIKKHTGNVRVMSFDSGETLTEKISPYDTLVQIIEGQAEIIIDTDSHQLKLGQGIILPAHIPNIIKASGRTKMMFTVIKSGYDI
ncbi:MAG: cupin domain-containing protein [Bacteroidia bacterium]|nr:cupin domain-containing protein [Bacteroidia bacterium]MBP9689788.1 cupin domain-containing protein [Bacteroidia bacterium]